MEAPVAGHGTTVSAVLDVGIPEGRNVLWCATMEMAWAKAAKAFDAPVVLEPPSPLAVRLNAEPYDEDWIDAASVFTTSGTVAGGTVAAIESGVRKLAGRGSKLVPELRKGGLAKNDLVFFAMLHKDLEFPEPFGKLGQWPVGGKKVKCFGFTPEQENTAGMHQQVKVHHYGDRDDFVIELTTKDANEQFVLARLPEAKNLAKASAAVSARLTNKPPSAAGNDLLMVPNIDIAELSRFAELEGRRVKANGLILRQALQSIDFKMDETGVKLDSEASISFGCAAQVPVVPRLIILKPPFVVMMKRRAAPQPYFVAWIANGDVLSAK